eukprot:COSAG06_NODE_2201_length_7352_cov_18.385771_5_plen_56_part_00
MIMMMIIIIIIIILQNEIQIKVHDSHLEAALSFLKTQSERRQIIGADEVSLLRLA